MQKVVNIRVSQNELAGYLEKFGEYGWKVVSVSKGSELGRTFTSYKWTVVLESNSPDADPEAVDKLTSGVNKTKAVTLGVFLVLLVALCLVIPLALLCCK